MRRECVNLCDATSLINTKASVKTKEKELWIQQHSNRDIGGIKLTYFTTTKTRTTTANSIKFPMQLVIKWQDKKLPVSLLRFWVNNEAENQNFTSIKMTLEFRAEEIQEKKKHSFFSIPIGGSFVICYSYRNQRQTVVYK